MTTYEFLTTGLVNWGAAACDLIRLMYAGGGDWRGNDDIGHQVWAGISSTLKENGGTAAFVSSVNDAVQEKYYRLMGDGSAGYSSEVGPRILDRLLAVDTGFIFSGDKHCQTALSVAMDKSKNDEYAEFMQFITALLDDNRSSPLPPFTCDSCAVEFTTGCDGVVGSTSLMDNCGNCRDVLVSNCTISAPDWVRAACPDFRESGQLLTPASSPSELPSILPSSTQEVATSFSPSASPPTQTKSPTPLPTSSLAPPTKLPSKTPSTNPYLSPSPVPSVLESVEKQVSVLSCDELGWTNPAQTVRGDPNVCSESSVDGCSGLVSWNAAVGFCEGAGARLCTHAELAADDARSTGCQNDVNLVWSSTRCGASSDIGFIVARGSSATSTQPICAAAEGLYMAACCGDVEVAVALDQSPAEESKEGSMPASISFSYRT